MVEWYYELLVHRNLKTTYGNFELEVTTDMGFPQGGVCNAKFWIILFTDDGNGLIGGQRHRLYGAKTKQSP